MANRINLTRLRRHSTATTAIAGLTMVLSGVACGYVTHRIGFATSLGFLFKLLIAFPLGLIGLACLHLLRVPRSKVIVFAGMGAIAAFASMHVFEYRTFHTKWRGAMIHTLFSLHEAELIPRLEQLKSRSEAHVDELKRLTPDRADLTAAKVEEMTPTEQAQKTSELQESVERLKSFKLKVQESERKIRKEERELEKAQEIGRTLIAVKPNRVHQHIQFLIQTINDEEPGKKLERLLNAYFEEVKGDAFHRMVNADQWLASQGFWKVMHLRARQGTVIVIPAPLLKNWPISFGRVGSYFAWILELCIAPILACVVLKKFTRSQDGSPLARARW